jgi:hypothetical protein
MSTTTVTSRAARRPRVFSVLTELRRQGSRPRTRIALAFMAALPLIVLAAFEFGGGGRDDDRDGGGAFSSLADVATAGGSNFALFTLLVSSSFLLVVVVALFFGDTIASEASWGSLRYLLAIPVPRSRLLGVKLVVSLIYSALAMGLLVGTALLAGTLRYGWNPLRSTIADEVGAEAFRLVLGERLHLHHAARGRRDCLPALRLDRRPARRRRRRGHDRHSVQHPGPDRRPGRHPQRAADALRRRLGGPALHAHPVGQHGEGNDLRAALRQHAVRARVLALPAQGHRLLITPGDDDLELITLKPSSIPITPSHDRRIGGG